MTNVLVGADPELFVYKDGKAVSAFGMIEGDKKHPFVVDLGAVQVDGMALEFNIDPAHDEEQFVNHINTVMDALKGMVPDYEVRAEAVAEFEMEYIKQQPMEAVMFGCDPDFCAWTGEINQSANPNVPYRTGAGHVHIGWTNVKNSFEKNHYNKCIDLVKQMDFYLGLPSLLFANDYKRRSMYGNPGCFRPKKYGCEYRVLSNCWLRSDNLKRWVYRNVQKGFERLVKGEALYEMTDLSILENLIIEKPNLD